MVSGAAAGGGGEAPPEESPGWDLGRACRTRAMSGGRARRFLSQVGTVADQGCQEELLWLLRTASSRTFSR